MRNGSLNSLFAIVLILNLTGLFSFAAISLGIPIAWMSAAILVFLMAYLLLHVKYAWWLFRKKDIFYWILFAFVWPAATSIYAVAPDLRLNALNLYLVALTLATAVWISVVGWQKAKWVVVAAAGITVFGLVLSMLQNEYFRSVAEAADARFSYFGRAFGFFLQPNMAAENMAFLFAILIPALASFRAYWRYIAGGVFVMSVLLTGSRGGILICLAIVAYAYFLSGKPVKGRGGARLLQQVLVVTVIAGAVVGANEFAKISGASTGSARQGQYTLADRLDSIQSLDLNSAQSGSVAARYVAATEHARGIVERPILGFGLGASSHFAAQGRLTYTSHNQYLQVAFDLGLLALVFFLVLLIRLWKTSRRIDFESIYRCNPAMMLLIGLCAASLFSNSVLNSRVFFAALGIVFAMQYSPMTRRGMKV